ncbi:hypothetical protein ACOTVZ_06075 [Aliarcobacter butzleri]
MFKDVKFFLIQIFTSSLVVYVIFLLFGNVSTPAICIGNQPDALTVANNFMVFITIIIAITTILLTVFGVLFTKWYSRERNKIIKDNMEEVINSIIEDSELKKYLISSILDNHLVKKDLEKLLIEFSSSQRADMKADFKSYKNELREYMKEQLKNSNIVEKEQKDVSKINELIQRVKDE